MWRLSLSSLHGSTGAFPMDVSALALAQMHHLGEIFTVWRRQTRTICTRASASTSTSDKYISVCVALSMLSGTIALSSPRGCSGNDRFPSFLLAAEGGVGVTTAAFSKPSVGDLSLGHILIQQLACHTVSCQRRTLRWVTSRIISFSSSACFFIRLALHFGFGSLLLVCLVLFLSSISWWCSTTPIKNITMIGDDVQLPTDSLPKQQLFGSICLHIHWGLCGDPIECYVQIDFPIQGECSSVILPRYFVRFLELALALTSDCSYLMEKIPSDNGYIGSTINDPLCGNSL